MKLKDKIELIKKYNASIRELDRVKQQVEEYEQFLKDSKKLLMINNHGTKDSKKQFYIMYITRMMINYSFLITVPQ